MRMSARDAREMLETKAKRFRGEIVKRSACRRGKSSESRS